MFTKVIITLALIAIAQAGHEAPPPKAHTYNVPTISKVSYPGPAVTKSVETYSAPSIEKTTTITRTITAPLNAPAVKHISYSAPTAPILKAAAPVAFAAPGGGYGGYAIGGYAAAPAPIAAYGGYAAVPAPIAAYGGYAAAPAVAAYGGPAIGQGIGYASIYGAPALGYSLGGPAFGYAQPAVALAAAAPVAAYGPPLAAPVADYGPPPPVEKYGAPAPIIKKGGY